MIPALEAHPVSCSGAQVCLVGVTWDGLNLE